MVIFILLLLILLPFIISAIKNIFFWDIPTGLIVFTGVPGAGKTTLCAYFTRVFKHRKKYKNKNIYCNVPILGTLKIDPIEDFGTNAVENGVCLCDEAGIFANNRKWKSLPQNVITFAKYYRHYGINSFLFFSQGLDIDVTFIRLANQICIVRKSYIPFFINVREVIKYIGIDDISHQLVDQYQYKRMGTHLIFAPVCWRLFDTYECPPLPFKDYPEWNNKTRSEYNVTSPIKNV